MKYLIFGGSGYLGSHLVEQLISNGHEVVIFDNESGQVVTKFLKNCTIVNANIARWEDFSHLDNFGKYDGVFHLAAKKSVPESLINPELYIQTNQNGTSNIIKYCTERKIKSIVFTSSAAIYGNVDSKAPIGEEITPIPINPYGSTKLQGELELSQAFQINKISSICLRIFNIVGASNKQFFDTKGENVLPTMVRKLVNRDEFIVYGNSYDTTDGTCVRDYVNVADVANAHVLAMNYLIDSSVITQHEILNISSGVGVSMLELIDKVESISNQNLKWKFGEIRAGDPASVIGASNSAKALLGWNPLIGIDQSIRESIGAFGASL